MELDRCTEAIFFVLARNKEKFDDIVSTHSFANEVRFIACNLDSFDSIESAVEEIGNQAKGIDLLINNAGHWSSDEISFSKDGIESTVAVNHLAPYLLTGYLLPLLCKSDSPGIVNTASFRHKDASVETSDIELKNNFDAELAYCNSKLYSVLFTKKLADLLEGTGVTVNCFDPGIVDTPMLKQAFPASLSFLYPLFRKFIARSPEKGAETGVYLSTGLPAENRLTGQYFKDKKPRSISVTAQDKDLGEWLWNESVKLTGFDYTNVLAS